MPHFEYTKDISLYYEEHGNPEGKETVVFMNGVMASANSWSVLWPVFEKAGFRVIAHDFKGQLRSSKPAGPYTFAQHSEETKALLDYLHVEKAHFVGTSYGGEVAMKFAAMYPEMTESISVIDSVSELDPVCKGFVASWKVLCDTGDAETFFWGMLPSIYGAEFIENNMEMLSARAAAMKAVPADYLEGQKILYDTFADDVYMTDELPKIQCPALIICAENDILKPPKFSKIMADNIPNSEYITIPGAAHVVFLEKTREVETAIFGFIMKHCEPFA